MDTTKLVKVAEFGIFNEARFGKPWLAKLNLIQGTTKLNYNFIQDAYIQNKDNGVLMAYLNDGDYIAYGQKDFRGNSSYSWHGIYRDGNFIEIPKSEIIATLASSSNE